MSVQDNTGLLDHSYLWDLSLCLVGSKFDSDDLRGVLIILHAGLLFARTFGKLQMATQWDGGAFDCRWLWAYWGSGYSGRDAIRWVSTEWREGYRVNKDGCLQVIRGMGREQETMKVPAVSGWGIGLETLQTN